MNHDEYEHMRNVERNVIDLRARLATSEAKSATQEAQIVELRQKLIELSLEQIHELRQNATEHLSAMGEEMTRFTDVVGKAFEVEMISSEIVVPLARRFPDLKVSQTRKGEGVISWTLGPEEYEVCIFVSLVKNERDVVIHPLRFKVSHDLGDDFQRANGIPFTEVCEDLDAACTAVGIIQAYIEKYGLEFIRAHEANAQ